MNPFTIKARTATPRHAEAWIYGDIGESWLGDTVTAREFVRDFSALDADTITVRVNSHGGSVNDGLAIYNAIKRHPAKTTIEIDGIAASIASLIAMAGDTVRIAENAMVMIHAPWSAIMGNAQAMREMADLMDKYAESMAPAYAGKTGKAAAEILPLLKDGENHWYSAQEAVAFGLADEISEAMPLAAHLDLSRYTASPTPTAAPAAQHKEPAMDQATQASALAPAAGNHEEIMAAGIKAEATRRTDIETAFAAFREHDGVEDLLASCLKDTATSAEAAGKKLLAALAQNASPATPQGYITTTEEETDKFRAAAVQAIMARAAVPGAKMDSANPYRGHKLVDLARACLERGKISAKGMDQMQIVASAFTQSTSDFPVLLEEAMHKTLQSAYATAPDTWRRFCGVGSVSDFRAHHRYRVGSLGNLESISELGEYKSKAIPDGEKSSISIGTKGNIINVSRQMVVNDDLGAFIGLTNMLGRAANRTLEAAVYALLAENAGLGPIMADSKTLFHADHGNIGTGAALTVSSLEADRVLMASQKDISGNDYLDLRPAVLVLPIGLGATARLINDAQFDPDAQNKYARPNISRGLFTDIVDTPRLTGTRQYIFASPADAPVIEVAFLDGNQTPYLEMQEGFDVDGTRFKVRMDFGVGAIDYRGAVTNAGVA